jgi:hypothetical protein
VENLERVVWANGVENLDEQVVWAHGMENLEQAMFS